MNNTSGKKQNPYARLLSYLRPYRGSIILAIVMIFLGVLAQTLAPLMMGEGINRLGSILKGAASGENGFLGFLLAMIVCYAAYALLTLFSSRILVKASQNVVYDLRRQVDAKLARLPLNYYDTTTYGDILARLTNDVDTVSNSLQESISQIVTTLFTIVLVFIVMISISG